MGHDFISSSKQQHTSGALLNLTLEAHLNVKEESFQALLKY
jgi:hypothetical protein